MTMLLRIALAMTIVTCALIGFLIVGPTVRAIRGDRD